jgi:hypothetical protein
MRILQEFGSSQDIDFSRRVTAAFVSGFSRWNFPAALRSMSWGVAVASLQRLSQNLGRKGQLLRQFSVVTFNLGLVRTC